MEHTHGTNGQPLLASFPNELLEMILLAVAEEEGIGIPGIARLARVCPSFRSVLEYKLYRSITHSPSLPLTPKKLLLLGRTLAENRQLASLVTSVDFRGLDSSNDDRRRWKDDRCKYIFNYVSDTAKALMRMQPDGQNRHCKRVRTGIMTRLNQRDGGSAMSLVVALAPNLHTAYLSSEFDFLAALHLFKEPTAYPKLKSLSWYAGSRPTRQGVYLINFISSAPNLEYLDLNGLSLPATRNYTPPNLARLTELRLENCRLQLDAIRDLVSTCTALESFVLTRSHDSVPQTLDFLAPISRTVRRLSVRCPMHTHYFCVNSSGDGLVAPLGTTTATSAAEVIRRFPNLRHLTFSQCYVHRHNPAVCEDEDSDCRQWLANLADAASQLEHLEGLEVTHVHGITLQHLQSMAETLAKRRLISPLREVALTPIPERSRDIEVLQQFFQGQATQVLSNLP